MVKSKGLIALDIDGTITIEKHHLEKNVSTFLNGLAEEGWQLLFLTGRTLSFTRTILCSIKRPYYLAVQNGAACYLQPEQKLLFDRYISMQDLPKIEEIVHHAGAALLLDSGSLHGDRVFFKTHEYSKDELAYIDYRKSFSPETWISCEDFASLALENFALGKVLTKKEVAFSVQHSLQQQMGEVVDAIVLRDPFREQGFLVHINARGASKREALLFMKEHRGGNGLVIAAGDDLNDYGMLLAGDRRITMAGAPQELLDIADIIAPSAAEEGIIEGLKKAIQC